MSVATKKAWVWSGMAALALLLCLSLGPQMRKAWGCIRAYNNGAEYEAQLESFVASGAEFRSLEDAGAASCIVASGDLPIGAKIGDEMSVVARADVDAVCTTKTTLEAANAIFKAVAAVLASLLLALVLLGRLLTRSLTEAPTLTTRLDGIEGLGEHSEARVPCPRCEKSMSEGYLPLVAGLPWRDADEATGMPHALQGLPGTVAWRGRPRLHALRCEPCEIVILRYGKGDNKRDAGLSEPKN